MLQAIGFQIDFYCDNSKEVGIEIRDGVKIISLGELYSLKDNVLVFITVMNKYQDSIKSQLEKNGIFNIVQVDYSFLQTFIESLIEIDNPKFNEQFKSVLDDAEYISGQFEYRIGYRPDLCHPKTFNEKLQWLKLHDRRQEYIRMVDKYEAKKYVADRIGEKYITPLLGVYDNFDEIEFGKLPHQFVLKCTHDSGSCVICKDKDIFDRKEAKDFLERSRRGNYYWIGREWPYKDVKPRIIAEKYLEDKKGTGFIDYKFLCSDGLVQYIFTCSDRNAQTGLRVNFYDKNWVPLPFERHYPKREKEIDRPEKLSEMIGLAEKLSKGLRFVRVDFYVINGNIYFGEFTFYPGGGMEEFTPSEWDLKLGEMINISA